MSYELLQSFDDWPSHLSNRHLITICTINLANSWLNLSFEFPNSNRVSTIIKKCRLVWRWKNCVTNAAPSFRTLTQSPKRSRFKNQYRNADNSLSQCDVSCVILLFHISSVNHTVLNWKAEAALISTWLYCVFLRPRRTLFRSRNTWRDKLSKI